MEVFTVSLFGHREVFDLRELHKRLYSVIAELIKEKEYVHFLIGRNGEFDEYAASVIRLARRELGNECCEISLVLPYVVSGVSDYERYYDGIVIPECAQGAHAKAAIGIKNRWMVERSDLVIAYVERSDGGAYRAARYAETLNKTVINLASKAN